MALIEIDKQTVELDSLGRARLSIRYRADSRSQALTGVPMAVEGLPRSGLRASPWLGADGLWLVDAVYEGLTEDPRPELDQFEIRTEERQQKIEQFEPRSVLVEDYGARITTVDEKEIMTFPATLPAPPSRMGTPLTLSNRGSAAEEPSNPLHNVTTYGVVASVAVWRLVRKKVPGSLAKQARTVIKKLPPGFDFQGDVESWYVRPLQLRKSGNAWEIEWTALEISEFRDFAVLAAIIGKESKGRGAGQGLTTGSL